GRWPRWTAARAACRRCVGRRWSTGCSGEGRCCRGCGASCRLLANGVGDDEFGGVVDVALPVETLDGDAALGDRHVLAEVVVDVADVEGDVVVATHATVYGRCLCGDSAGWSGTVGHER